MKLFPLTFFFSLFLVNSKLITKATFDKNGDSAEGFIKEILIAKDGRNSSSEYFKFYNKRIRMPRDSNEHTVKPQSVTKYRRTSKLEAAPVKKPIGEFIDAGSEEDYQAKMRFPLKYSDSTDHEDEDFNLDDYDFDVSHDEFAGRGKPLEPRIKVNLNRQIIKLKPAKLAVQPRLAPALSQSKVVLTQNKGKASIKVVRKAADKMKEEESDEACLADSRAPEQVRKSFNKEDAFSGENEDSKEEESKGPVRTARSWLNLGTYVDKLGEKTSAFISKILTYLPLFNQTYSSPKNYMRRLSRGMNRW